MSFDKELGPCLLSVLYDVRVLQRWKFANKIIACVSSKI
jgi:hypothetical protein